MDLCQGPIRMGKIDGVDGVKISHEWIRRVSAKVARSGKGQVPTVPIDPLICL